MILDIGPRSIEQCLLRARPHEDPGLERAVGAFELEPFDTGTVEVAEAGGGNSRPPESLYRSGAAATTVAALNAAGVTERFTYVSTAGGAFFSSGSRARSCRGSRCCGPNNRGK